MYFLFLQKHFNFTGAAGKSAQMGSPLGAPRELRPAAVRDRCSHPPTRWGRVESGSAARGCAGVRGLLALRWRGARRSAGEVTAHTRSPGQAVGARVGLGRRAARLVEHGELAGGLIDGGLHVQVGHAARALAAVAVASELLKVVGSHELRVTMPRGLLL